MKVDLFAKAKWMIGRGIPPSYVAERLNVSRTTLWSWRRLMNHDSTFKELRRRVLMLPAHLRDQLVTDLSDARRAAA